MSRVAFRRFDQIGNQVVATLQLHVDLGERVLEPIAKRDEAVVDSHDPKGEDDYDQEQDSQDD